MCVKLTDMGISANPLVHRVGEANGFKLLVPECLIANTMSTLTEKVLHYMYKNVHAQPIFGACP